MTERQFFYHLKQMGYDIKVGKDITVRPPNYPRGRKLTRNFGEEYSLESIRRRILAQSHPQRTHRPQPQRCRLHGDLKQARKVTGFRALYFHYCYLLGVFPKKQNRQPRRASYVVLLYVSCHCCSCLIYSIKASLVIRICFSTRNVFSFPLRTNL